MSFDIIKRRTLRYSTGLLKPAKKVCASKPFSVKLTKSETLEIINDPQRLPAREQFGPDFIIDQGPLGQCNAVAACGSLQRAFFKYGFDCPRLSSNWLYAQINGGRDNGSMLDDGMDAIKKGVPVFEPSHNGKYKKNQFPESLAESLDHKAFECYGVNSESELAAGLALGFTAIVAVHCNNDWFKMDRDEIIIRCNGVGNHAVTVDDVRVIDGELAFDHAGSWGVNIHNKGRAFLTWKRHLSGPNKNHFFYLVRATKTEKDLK